MKKKRIEITWIVILSLIFLIMSYFAIKAFTKESINKNKLVEFFRGNKTFAVNFNNLTDDDIIIKNNPGSKINVFLRGNKELVLEISNNTKGNKSFILLNSNPFKVTFDKFHVDLETRNFDGELEITLIEEDFNEWTTTSGITKEEIKKSMSFNLADFEYFAELWGGYGLKDIKQIRIKPITEKNGKIIIKNIYLTEKKGNYLFINMPKLNFSDFTPTRNLYPLEKKNNTFRIAILGDSMTYSSCAISEYQPTEKQIFSHLIEQKLNNNTNVNFEVLNFAVLGYNTEYEVNDFLENGIKYLPDFLILVYFSNDWEDLAELERLMNELKKEEAYQRLLKAGIDEYEFRRIISEDSMDIYYNEILPTIDDKMSLVINSLDKLKNEIEIPVLFVTFYESEEEQLTVLRPLVKKYNWSLLELNWIVDKYGKEKIYCSPEIPDNHPSVFAHTVIADALYEKLIKERLVPIEDEA